MIEQLIREERKTPVAGKSDVLAVGGGQAGVSAASRQNAPETSFGFGRVRVLCSLRFSEIGDDSLSASACPCRLRAAVPCGP